MKCLVEVKLSMLVDAASVDDTIVAEALATISCRSTYAYRATIVKKEIVEADDCFVQTVALLEMICKHCGVSVESVLSSSRLSEDVRARHIFFFFCRLEKLEWRRMGACVNRDHVTAMRGARKIVKEMSGDGNLKRLVEKIKKERADALNSLT